jgi:AcrR family transcriptional regulator
MTEADEPRRRVLALAQQRFLSHGYSRVTMDELASELGMSKKTLYRLFPSKEALGQEVIEAGLRAMSAGLRGIATDEALDFPERLRRFVWTVAGGYARGATFLRDLQRDAPALWQRVVDIRRESVQAGFGELFAAGVRAGELRSDVEPKLVVRMMLVLVDQLLRPDVLAELGLGGDAVFSSLFDVVLNGIRAEPSRLPRPSRRSPKR